MEAESPQEQRTVSFDRAKIIEEMKRDSGLDDFIPITLRFHTSFYNQVNAFCKVTGVKKAVLIRRLCEIGWKVVIGEENEREEV